MNKVRIVSDGTSRALEVFLEDGTRLEGITKLEFSANPGATIVHISMLCINPEMDITTLASISKVEK